MELKSIILFFIKFKLKIITSSIIGLAVGIILFYTLPVKYICSGSLFIKREIYPYSNDHFTYEGFYGQQAAMSYTNSVIGLIESIDTLAETLNTLNIPINEKNLRQYSHKIKAIKTGPQIITISVKENTSQKAESLWLAVADTTLNTMEKINSQNDPYVGLVKISETPVLKTSYKNIYVFSFLGLLAGGLASMIVCSLKNYMTSIKKR